MESLKELVAPPRTKHNVAMLTSTRSELHVALLLGASHVVRCSCTQKSEFPTTKGKSKASRRVPFTSEVESDHDATSDWTEFEFFYDGFLRRIPTSGGVPPETPGMEVINSYFRVQPERAATPEHGGPLGRGPGGEGCDQRAFTRRGDTKSHRIPVNLEDTYVSTHAN